MDISSAVQLIQVSLKWQVQPKNWSEDFFGSQWKEGSFVMLRIGVTATSAQDLFVWANTDTHFCIEEEGEEKAALRDERRSLSDETRRRKNISQSRCVYIQSLTKVFNTFNISDQAFQTHPV